MDEFLKDTEIDNIMESQTILNKEIVNTNEYERERELIREQEYGGEELNKNVEEENKKPNDDSDSQSSSSASGSGAAAGGAAAAVAVVAVVVMIITGAVSNILAKFSKLDVFGNSFFFEIVVSMEYIETEDNIVDFENSDTGLILVISKNKFSKTVNLKTDEPGVNCVIEKTLKKDKENEYLVLMTFSGFVEGLIENTRYKVEVIGDEAGKTVKYATEEIKTIGKVTEFKNITYHCACSINGELSFNINYLDENNFYSAFKYSLVSKEGIITKSGEILNPKDKQIITRINELPGKDYVLILEFESKAQADLIAKNEITEFNGGKITINEGKVIVAIDVKL